MSKTLTTLRTDVRTYLDEDTQSDWKDTDINRAINKYYHAVVASVMETYENYYITEATADIVANQQEYALPSDFFKMRRVEINYDISNSPTGFTRAIPIDIDSVRYNLGNTNTSVGVLKNAAYYLQGSILGFLPVPSIAGDEAIKIWYIAYQSDLTAEGDTINIPYPDYYYGIITKKAAAEALRKGQQEVAEADRLNSEADKDLEKMKRQLEDRVAEESKGVIDTSGESLDFGR